MTADNRSPTVTVAAGVHGLRTGWWRLASNVYFVESGASWVLVDAGWHGNADVIRSAAERLFGRGTRPAAILLTHVHPDHSGAAAQLAHYWGLPVHVHPAEVTQASGGIVPGQENPLDRFLVAPVLRLLPRRLAPGRDPLAAVVRELDCDSPPPGLSDWRCVPAPGHTPGSVAFFRPTDRVLITGDAILTIDSNSLSHLLRSRAVLAGPPWISTWNWAKARASVGRLAGLEPEVVAPGHGPAMTGIAPALHTLPAPIHRPDGVYLETAGHGTDGTPQPAPAVTSGSRLGTALLAASAAGAPTMLLALSYLGRPGRVLVTTGCGVLLARDAAMVASGIPARLRPLPRILLFIETAMSATAVATGVRSWLGPSRRTSRLDRPSLGLAAAATLLIHTARFAIYLGPGTGLLPPPRPGAAQAEEPPRSTQRRPAEREVNVR